MSNQLNGNNFLRWTGAFGTAPFTVVANNDSVNVFDNAISVDISALANDTATNGIDPATLIITLQDNLTTPATWNSVTQKVTYYLPVGVTVGAHLLKYTFQDLNGNVSNEGTITINVLARPTGWRGYGPSYGCELDIHGDRTGNGLYDNLEKYYTDDNTAVTPQVLKANSSSDPDYIAPTADPNCNPAGYLVWSLSDGLIDDACALFVAGTVSDFYTHDTDTVLSSGVFLFSDTALTSPAGGGWYSDGAQKYRVSSGQIVNMQYC